MSSQVEQPKTKLKFNFTICDLRDRVRLLEVNSNNAVENVYPVSADNSIILLLKILENAFPKINKKSEKKKEQEPFNLIKRGEIEGLIEKLNTEEFNVFCNKLYNTILPLLDSRAKSFPQEEKALNQLKTTYDLKGLKSKEAKLILTRLYDHIIEYKQLNRN